MFLIVSIPFRPLFRKEPGKTTGSFDERDFNSLALTDCVNGKKAVV
jgi:hypothetical protein